MTDRSIWIDFRDDVYDSRCGFCGKWKKVLKEHWFFSGAYCVSCIQDVLYDDARTMEEMK